MSHIQKRSPMGKTRARAQSCLKGRYDWSLTIQGAGQFTRSNSVPEPEIHSILPDILPSIFAYLGEADLARCLRVNHLFFDLAGRWLYWDLKLALLVVDKTMYQQKSTQLEGLRSPSWALPLEYIGVRKSVPSAFKVALLSHTRIVSYRNHSMAHCIRRPIPNLLPSVKALFISLAAPVSCAPRCPCGWSCPILASIQPIEVCIWDYRPKREEAETIPLDTLYGNCAKAVTILADDYQPLATHHAELVSIDWPRSMIHLRIGLVRCMRPYPIDPSLPLAPNNQSFAKEYQPKLLGSEFTTSTVALLLSAEALGAKIRIVALERFVGFRVGTTSGMNPSEPDEAGALFRRQVLDGYRAGLLAMGRSAEEADRRVGEVVIDMTDVGDVPEWRQPQ